jgi:hypothetical protein
MLTIYDPDGSDGPDGRSCFTIYAEFGDIFAKEHAVMMTKGAHAGKNQERGDDKTMSAGDVGDVEHGTVSGGRNTTGEAGAGHGAGNAIGDAGMSLGWGMQSAKRVWNLEQEMLLAMQVWILQPGTRAGSLQRKK